MSDNGIERLRSLPAAEKAPLREAVRVLIITGLGLNCEQETAAAFRLAGASPEQVHLLDLLEGDGHRKLTEASILAFIGGFAFGDHLGAGFVFANKIRWKLYEPLVEFIEAGGMAIGICNGFQMMVRLGMLPGFDGDYRTPRLTLAPNDRLGYRDAWIRLAFDAESPCVWTRDLEGMDCPIRHGEGKFLAESEEVLQKLKSGHQIVTRYVDDEGAPTQEWPHNPNGSPDAVAGICDPTGRLFGLMPHPEAFLYPYQHPQWARDKYSNNLPREGAGLAVFRNGVDAAACTLAGELPESEPVGEATSTDSD
jgi:phosphoribosylformylglycinamidine synthase